MMPSKGRSSGLGERALGHMDPGAKSCQVMISAVCQHIQRRVKPMKNFSTTQKTFSKKVYPVSKAHQNILQVHFDPIFVTRKSINSDKVILISGGSGHEPLHAGFIGNGMLDAACPGHVFTSPTPDQMMAAIEFCKPNKGALFIVKNYSGDVMNFEMAAEMTTYENASILVNDDAAVIDSSYTTGKRGVAGTVIVEKIVGSLAENGGDLKSCVDLGMKLTSDVLQSVLPYRVVLFQKLVSPLLILRMTKLNSVWVFMASLAEDENKSDQHKRL